MTDLNENHPDFETQEQIHSEKIPFIDRHAIHPLGFIVASLLIVFFLYQVGGSLVTLIVVGKASVTIDNVWTMRLLTVVGEIGFIFLPTLVLAKLFANRLKEVFDFKVPGILESIFAFISLLSLQFVFDSYLFFQERIPLPEVLRQVIEPLKKAIEEMMRIIVHAGSPVELVAVIFIVAVVPCIVEELLFRGLIQKVFERLMSPIAAAIITGTIFGLFHLNPFEAVPLIGIGIFLGILRYRSRNLLMPIIMHFLNNFIAVLASYQGLNDETILVKQESAADARTMLFMLIGFGALFIVSFRAYLRITGNVSKNIRTS